MNEELFNLIDRLSNLLRQEIRTEGLKLGIQPIQQEALHYLSSCNRYSDTTLAVTEYLGLTKGTVSQTLKVLENKELIVKQKDPLDKRVTHLKVTSEGYAFLEKTYPPPKFTEAINQLAPKKQIAAKSELTDVLRNYQQSTGRTAFGLCQNCKFNLKSVDGILCGLTKEALSIDDTQLICREYSES